MADPEDRAAGVVASTGLHVVDDGTVAVNKAFALVTVALADRAIPVPTIEVIVVLAGISDPPPVIVSPACIPTTLTPCVFSPREIKALGTPVTAELPLVVDPIKEIEQAGTTAPTPGAVAVIGTNVSETVTVPEGVPFPCVTPELTPTE
jgi:hypothetical protein